ncbi:UdgX family uracil-DNA binding protein [Sphingomonas colocasiae]|uniref:Type-4 uracil-DNA glycosylase n=1 Tax=Sphingomonas colocasiae TaxID=1848973 RepID=A0ABS7PXC5_9SPHN|nr:UdgX family uracil-DNA binding protein [Sphingomonas colocasiae]MBY8826010.1 UdgX family uracil-DNA binding protein [Sphingomonas colocasiae]
MQVAALADEDDFEGWRRDARTLAVAGVPPGQVTWQVGAGAADLFADRPVPPTDQAAFSVPRAFLDLAESAILHRDPERFALLYTLLSRLMNQSGLIEDRADALVRRLTRMAGSVRRDMHKMRAFLRFRETSDTQGPRFVAWFEPEHHIVRANAGFFVRRFPNMRWSILTPELSLHWDGETLSEGPGARREDAPGDDPVEAVWKTYYASIFNPARLKPGMMLKEMPRRYWHNMPETALVPQLIAGAQARESGMIRTARTAPPTNIDAAWTALRDEAEGCTRCQLHKHATQTVFGEGPLDAGIMLVGEQPGDQEDVQGRPFVGPAGQVLDDALAAAGIDRGRVYLTNAVKHFKYELRGKRRIHQRPLTGEINACRWWIEQEALLIRPKVAIALGATAAQSLFGRAMKIGESRGRAIALPDGGEAWITIHPSYLLRMQGDVEAERTRFVEELRMAARSVR